MPESRDQKEQGRRDQQSDAQNEELDVLLDLDVHPDAASKVKGGLAGDPCDGGQFRRR